MFDQMHIKFLFLLSCYKINYHTLPLGHKTWDKLIFY